MMASDSGAAGATVFAEFQGKLYSNGSADGSVGLAVWDGAAWSGVGGGVVRSTGGQVQTLAVGNDGSGEALFIGGGINSAGGVPGTETVAKWDGSSFSALGTGLWLDSTSRADGRGAAAMQLHSFQKNLTGIASLNGSVLFSGDFNKAGQASTDLLTCSNVAEWKAVCVIACPADFNGDTVRDVADLFGFINAWLAKTANADFNHDTLVDVADLFGFINAWLVGC